MFFLSLSHTHMHTLHQLLIYKWDGAITRSVLSHWLDLMNTRGWIPREQILGSEARDRVPKEFIEQPPDNANPPTWFLVVEVCVCVCVCVCLCVFVFVFVCKCV